MSADLDALAKAAADAHERYVRAVAAHIRLGMRDPQAPELRELALDRLRAREAWIKAYERLATARAAALLEGEGRPTSIETSAAREHAIASDRPATLPAPPPAAGST